MAFGSTAVLKMLANDLMYSTLDLNERRADFPKLLLIRLPLGYSTQLPVLYRPFGIRSSDYPECISEDHNTGNMSRRFSQSWTDFS